MTAADIHFLVPGDPATPTGGFLYDRHAIEGLRQAGILAGTIRIDGPFPVGDAATLGAAAAVLPTVPSGHAVIVDGLAFTALAPVLAEHAGRLHLIALVHHPLGDETGLSAEKSARWHAAETTALAHAHGVIVTSHTTRRGMRALGLDPDAVRAVTPGVDPAGDLSFRDHREAGPIRLLCVASLIPRKGQHLLVEALAPLAGRDWTLDLVGDARDPGYAAQVRALAGRHGLSGRIAFTGAVSDDALDAYWRRADAFVFPSLHEGWGIAPVEAVRWGLPVITSDGGALPEAVPAAARVLVPAGDVAALSGAIARMLDDPDHRSALASGARSTAASLRSWDDMHTEFAAVVGGMR